MISHPDTRPTIYIKILHCFQQFSSFSTCSKYSATFSPQNHPAIFDHYHLVPCLLTLPHSLYLFPKRLLVPSKSFPNRPPHSFRNVNCFFTRALCARYLSCVSLSHFCSYSSKVFLFSATAKLIHSTSHSPLFSGRPHVSCPHKSLVHSITPPHSRHPHISTLHIFH